MEVFRRLARPFWVIAFLLWAGVGTAHLVAQANERDCDPHCVAGELPAAPTEPESESSAEHCCHVFSPGNLPATNCAAPRRAPRPAALLSLANASAPESPAREIDYPPQLS